MEWPKVYKGDSIQKMIDESPYYLPFFCKMKVIKIKSEHEGRDISITFNEIDKRLSPSGLYDFNFWSSRFNQGDDLILTLYTYPFWNIVISIYNIHLNLTQNRIFTSFHIEHTDENLLMDDNGRPIRPRELPRG